MISIIVIIVDLEMRPPSADLSELADFFDFSRLRQVENPFVISKQVRGRCYIKAGDTPAS
jgi:hypothetical protein